MVIKRCKGCGAQVFFARNIETGRVQILNWPTKLMQVVSADGESTAVRACTTDHHATCINPNGHKNNEGAKEG